jgi:ribonuclease H2 subunit A
MVYSAAFTNQKDELSQFKVNDSKVLSETQRNSIFNHMKKNPNLIKNNLIIIDAHELSTKMLKREKYNLNLISHDAAEQLIRMSNEQIDSMNGILKEVYVDTVGDPGKYQNKLQTIFPEIKIIVSKKADSIYPIVSAASIFAKVTRGKN